jgi:hypothetical protein
VLCASTATIAGETRSIQYRSFSVPFFLPTPTASGGEGAGRIQSRPTVLRRKQDLIATDYMWIEWRCWHFELTGDRHL